MADLSDKDVERLRSIKSFPSLIKYLRDELGWDISSDQIDELTFDYTPEELGIDPKTAAKIQEIKRLRPLSPQQPWGIFFVKFEPKRLPVVVLRKILANVAIKKRASSRKSDQASWDCDDLLFVSNYGEGEDRQISFAHFSQDVDRKRPPVLKVLGWDSQNTNLRYQETIQSLREKLSWREEYSKNIELWRKDWRSAFTLRHRQTINDSKKLASQLAELARSIRGEINEVLAIETEKGSLRQIMESFRESLIHDIDEDQFADMYAQTISYGLLSSRMVDPEAKGTDDFASHMRTNPFLRELMETFIEVGGRKKKGKATIDFDDLGVNDVIEMLDDVDMKAVLLDFGDRNPQEDPVIHFFEGFLQEYDRSKKKDRGVFYTPRPVVSFIVRSVDELLRTEFGLEDGLADTTTWGEMAGRIDDLEIPEGATPEQAFVQILDPATGTGTFLVEVIDLIHKTMTAKWQAEGHGKKNIEKLWNAYVPEHLLPRLHGYELMMAPYAIAHMKIGLKLYETGYRFESDERARVYLTNALEPAQDFSGTLAFAIPALAHEAEAVNGIKRDQRFTVVIGNPPYSNYGQLNSHSFILELLEDYKQDLSDKKINLDDDFIKFVRFSTHLLEQSASGLLGMITNSVFIDGLTHRRMREKLIDTFDLISILDLHGSARKREVAPDGSEDQNVFDIQQGVGIVLAVTKNGSENARVQHSELWGSRQLKYDGLASGSVMMSESTTLEPTSPFFFFTSKDFSLAPEYETGWKLDEIFDVQQNCIKTDRDTLFFDFDKRVLVERIQKFYSRTGLDQGFRTEFRVEDSSSYNLLSRREKTNFSPSHVRNCLYRPFDERSLYYHLGLTSRPAWDVMQHMIRGRNLGLLAKRQSKREPFSYIWCTNSLVESCVFESAYANNSLFPLYLFAEDSEGELIPEARRVNLYPAFLRELENCVLSGPLAPEEAFHYIYGVLHSPSYRNRYAEFLKIDFPRVLIPSSPQIFHALSRLGCNLVSLHLLESPKLDDHLTTLLGSGDIQVEKVSYSDETVWIDKAKTRGFKGVPEEVWNFHIGGYQVCEKWLKDRQAKGGKNPRPGRVLTGEDIEHYQKIVVALAETIRIMAEIDEVIEAHGGWPGAFQTGEVSEPADQPDPEDSQASLL